MYSGPSRQEEGVRERGLPEDDAGTRLDPPKSASSHGSRGYHEHNTLDPLALSGDFDVKRQATWGMSAQSTRRHSTLGISVKCYIFLGEQLC